MKKEIFCKIIVFFTTVFFLGCGVGPTEKAPFEDVSSWGDERIEFKGVYLEKSIGGYDGGYVKRYVKADVAYHLGGDGSIDVVIDRSIPGTLISINPIFLSKLFFADSGVYAWEVIIWARSQTEKEAWEKWIKEKEAEYRSYQAKKNAKPIAKTIMPPVEL